MNVDREAILEMAQAINPASNKFYSDKQIAQSLQIPPGRVYRVRIEEGLQRYPIPKLNPISIPTYDRAAMLALPMSGYQTEIVHRGHQNNPTNLFKIGTESSDPKFINIMNGFFQDIGVPTNNKAKPGFPLNAESFNFLSDPLTELNKQFLKSKESYTPFLFTLMMLRLSSKEHRLTFNRERESTEQVQKEAALLEDVNDRFASFGFRTNSLGFGLKLGEFDIRKDTGSGFIIVDQPADVLKALRRQRSVTNLKLLKYKQTSIDSTQDPGDQELDLMINNFIPDAKELRSQKDREAQIARNFLLEN
jgi:hypothetical protein